MRTTDNIVKTANLLGYRFRYLINYIIIGLLSIVVELIILNFLKSSNLNFIAIIIIGFLCGMYFAFILNAKLNFNVPKSRNTKTFIAFLSISTGAFVLNLILITLLSNFTNVNYGVLRIISAGLIFLITYTFHRRITFDFIKKVGIAVYLNRGEEVSKIYSKIKYYGDFIHVDIVDQTINPNAKPIDMSLINKIDETWTLKKMIHIMSRKPTRWINYLGKHFDIIIFHTDIDEPIEKIINLCKSKNKQIGICLAYDDPVESVLPFLNKIDFIQVMGIKKLGASGQYFNPNTLEKVNQLNKLKKKHRFEIIFDGGVKPTNIHKINAKYIVSASGLLATPNPIESFMELKTSSRYHSIGNSLNEDLKNNIKSIIKSTPFINSGTIVGSFVEKDNLNGISDIDIIIIADKLTKEKYNKIIKKFEELKHQTESKYGYEVIINPTFGPLKFNDNNIVFHLMIYDEKSHKDHCIKSPFTCYDWQISSMNTKKSMSDIYKIHHLQPNYFLSSRRSIKDYSNDIRSSQISYREYKFEKDKIIEELKSKKLDERHKMEFAFHIIKFLITNFTKLYTRENKNHEFNRLIENYFMIFPKNKQSHLSFIKKLYYLKITKSSSNLEITKNLDLFLEDFELQFRDYFYNKSKKLTFIRHCKTPLNKGTFFLGKSDAKIIAPTKEEIKNNLTNQQAYSSPENRCLETLKLISDQQPIIDNNLSEIDYGEANQKDLDYLTNNHLNIIEAWEMGQDPKFPDGENQADVVKRIKSFLQNIQDSHENEITICTHNVFLRCLIGMSLKLHYTDWFKIIIPHFKELTFLLTKDNRIYIEFTPEQIEEIFKNL
jgi:ribulose-phosphate 3-epimerase